MSWESWGTEHLAAGDCSEEDWFSLGKISEWLAVDVKGKAQLIARALLQDFQAGRFDGPYKVDIDASQESDYLIIVPNPKVNDGIDLRWRQAWTDFLGRQRWSLLDSQSAQALFADSYPVENSTDAGGESFWLSKEAVNRWCDWHGLRRLSSWPPTDNQPQVWASRDEILWALKTVGPSKKWKIPALINEVGRLLGKPVSKRSLDEAKKEAASKGVICLYSRGNPGKAERTASRP
jgi:hypothetical protein